MREIQNESFRQHLQRKGSNENVSYCAPGFAFFVRHAQNVSFANCHVSTTGPDARPWSAVKDVSGLSGSCSP